MPNKDNKILLCTDPPCPGHFPCLQMAIRIEPTNADGGDSGTSVGKHRTSQPVLHPYLRKGELLFSSLIFYQLNKGIDFLVFQRSTVYAGPTRH